MIGVRPGPRCLGEIGECRELVRPVGHVLGSTSACGSLQAVQRRHVPHHRVSDLLQAVERSVRSVRRRDPARPHHAAAWAILPMVPASSRGDCWTAGPRELVTAPARWSGRVPHRRPGGSMRQGAPIAGLTMGYNSGAVEGTVNRIKQLKAAMYGRAKPDLLRKLILLA